MLTIGPVPPALVHVALDLLAGAATYDAMPLAAKGQKALRAGFS